MDPLMMAFLRQIFSGGGPELPQGLFQQSNPLPIEGVNPMALQGVGQMLQNQMNPLGPMISGLVNKGQNFRNQALTRFIVQNYLQSNPDVSGLQKRLSGGNATPRETQYWQSRTGGRTDPRSVATAHFSDSGSREQRALSPGGAVKMHSIPRVGRRDVPGSSAGG